MRSGTTLRTPSSPGRSEAAFPSGAWVSYTDCRLVTGSQGAWRCGSAHGFLAAAQSLGPGDWTAAIRRTTIAGPRHHKSADPKRGESYEQAKRAVMSAVQHRFRCVDV